MSDLTPRAKLSRRAPWLIGGAAAGVFVAALLAAQAERYPPLRAVYVARASGWLALTILAAALCVSPLARLAERFGVGAARFAAPIRRLTGMTAAWLALLHACTAEGLLDDGTLRWLLATPHVRAGL